MGSASVTAAVAAQVITATFWNNTINAILNQLNGNIDEDNIIDGAITAAKLAVDAVDLSTSKVTGNIPIARFNSGTSAGSTTFWRGDGTWAGIAPSIGGAFRNLRVTRTDAATVNVTADELVIQTSGGVGNKISSVNVSAAISASGANGLDSGSEASSTWYYIYVIRKSSDGTLAALLSTSSSSPSLPSGYDQKALVGSVRNDGSSNFVDFLKYNNDVFFVMTSVLDSSVTQTSYADIDCSTVVPPNCVGFFQAYIDNTAGIWKFKTKGFSTDMWASLVTDNGDISVSFEIPVSAASLIQYLHTTGAARSIKLSAYGYRFTL